MNKKFSDNKIKKCLYVAAVFIICIEMFFCFYDEKCLTVYAATKAFQDSDDYDDIFEKLEIAADDYTGLSYKEIFAYILSGDINGLAGYIFSGITESITHEIKNNNTYVIELLAIIILGSVFSGLSGRLGKMVSGNGFFVTYLIAAGILLGIFTIAYEIADETAGNISELMLTFIPAYSLSVSYTTGAGSAELTYEATIFIIYLCESILCGVVFPIAKCSAVIGLVNKMNTEDYFSKTVTLLNNIAGWIIKCMLAFVTGFNIIRGIITPTIDKASRNAVLKTFGMLPGGSAVKNLSDILLGSGLLLKNAIGIAGAVLVIAVSLLPVLKIAIIYLMLRAVSAVTQPMGDKRFSDAVNITAGVIGIILRGMWCAALMFIISITLMTLLTG